MTELLDAIGACDLALYTALDCAIGDVAVFQDVPQDTPIGDGLVIIGNIENATPLGSKGDPDREMPLLIEVLTEGEERGPCARIVAAIERLLGDAVLVVPGWHIRPILERSTVIQADDALGYVGMVQFRVLALAE